MKTYFQKTYINNMIKQKFNKLKPNIPLFIVIVVAIFILFTMISCATLQKANGFHNYPSNTDWRVRIL